MTSTTADAGTPPIDDGVDEARDGHRAGTALLVALVGAALILGGAIGWRIGRTQGETEPPAHASVDVGFFQDMSTHHSQAVSMGLIYLYNGTDPLLHVIAGEIVTYQASETGIMGEYLRRWGESGTEGATAMAWMGMPTPRADMFGLATKAEMRELGTARGRDLDQLFTRLMIEHHVGGIHMAEYAAKEADLREVRRWAVVIEHGQRGEISELNRWRVKHDMEPVDPGIA